VGRNSRFVRWVYLAAYVRLLETIHGSFSHFASAGMNQRRYRERNTPEFPPGVTHQIERYGREATVFSSRTDTEKFSLAGLAMSCPVPRDLESESYRGGK
jgi:hypothetical protein